MLHIGFLNIHDLSDHKREDDDFQSYVNSYDIVAFVETLNDSPGNLPEFTSPFFTKPTKRTRGSVGWASVAHLSFCFEET